MIDISRDPSKTGVHPFGFGLVCIILVGALINFMASGKKKKDVQDNELKCYYFILF